MEGTRLLVVTVKTTVDLQILQKRVCSDQTCRSSQMFGVAKDICSNFPNFPEKFLCDLCLLIFFSHKDHEDLILV